MRLASRSSPKVSRPYRSWNFLREHGCELAQGYVLARPLGVEEVSELLRSRLGVELLLERAAG